MSQPILEAAAVSPRQAYGQALVQLGFEHNDLVVLDAETSNSTFAEDFKKVAPERFIECFIAEQSMVSMALGLSRRGKVPFVSTFGAFFTRAFDQIRISQYSQGNIKFVGSHCGVSIGEDGPSQMALEDIAMFRSVQGMTVLYPSDAESMKQAVVLAYEHSGNVYIRSTRAATEPIMSPKTKLKIGRSNTIFESKEDAITIFAAGITLHESIKAYHTLKADDIFVRIIDVFSIKPLDTAVIAKACKDTKALVVVEDHYREGGIYEAICASGEVIRPTYSLSVTKTPRSGKPEELLRYEEIDAQAIISLCKKLSDD